MPSPESVTADIIKMLPSGVSRMKPSSVGDKAKRQAFLPTRPEGLHTSNTGGRDFRTTTLKKRTLRSRH